MPVIIRKVFQDDAGKTAHLEGRETFLGDKGGCVQKESFLVNEGFEKRVSSS